MTSGRDVSTIVETALNRGWITPATVHDPGVLAWDASRSHDVIVLAIGNGGIVVKRHRRPDRDDVQGSRTRDVLAHRLAADASALRGLAPAIVAIDDDHLVLTRVDGIDLAALRRHRGDDRARRLAAVADALGRWHAGARHRATDHPPVHPWVLDALADDRPDFLVQNLGAAALLERAADRIAPLLAGLDAAWRPSTVVHGDLRTDNVMVGSDGVTFIDWETSGHGDPAWDVGALLSEVLADAGVREVGHRLTPRVRDELAAVLTAWHDAIGTSGHDLDRRVGLACAGRLLLRALQVAGAGEQEVPEEERLLALAVDLAAAPERLRELAGASP